MLYLTHTPRPHIPWNKGRLIGQRPPLKLREIWAVRIRLQLKGRIRELALFNLAIDSKLRGCDLVRIKVRDISSGHRINSRAMVMQQKTHQAVQFEITDQTQESLRDWIKMTGLNSENSLFPSRVNKSDHLSPRQYARIVKS